MSGSGGEIELVLPDASRRSVPDGTSAGSVLQAWRPKEAREFLAARFDGRSVDLAQALHRSGALAPLTFRGPGRSRHAAALGRPCRRQGRRRGGARRAPDRRPAHRGGVLLRLRRPPAHARGPVEDRSRDRRHHPGRGEIRTRWRSPREEAERLCAGNPHKLGYVREIPDGGIRLALPDRGLSRPLPGPPRPRYALAQGAPSPRHLRRIGRRHRHRAEPPADPGHRVPDPGRARQVPRPPQGGGGAGPPHRRAAHGAVHVPRGGPRLPVLAPQGDDRRPRAGAVRHRAPRQRRATRRSAHRSCSPRACTRRAATGSTTERTCSSPSPRSGRSAGSR